MSQPPTTSPSSVPAPPTSARLALDAALAELDAALALQPAEKTVGEVLGELLNEAVLAGRLDQADADDALAVMRQYDWVADNMRLAIYTRLGSKRSSIGQRRAS